MTTLDDVLEYAQAALVAGVKTCLVCHHYRVTEGGAVLVCRKRKRTRDIVATFDERRYETVCDRAHECRDRDFEP